MQYSPESKVSNSSIPVKPFDYLDLKLLELIHRIESLFGVDGILRDNGIDCFKVRAFYECISLRKKNLGSSVRRRIGRYLSDYAVIKDSDRLLEHWVPFSRNKKRLPYEMIIFHQFSRQGAPETVLACLKDSYGAVAKRWPTVSRAEFISTESLGDLAMNMELTSEESREAAEKRGVLQSLQENFSSGASDRSRLACHAVGWGALFLFSLVVIIFFIHQLSAYAQQAQIGVLSKLSTLDKNVTTAYAQAVLSCNGSGAGQLANSIANSRGFNAFGELVYYPRDVNVFSNPSLSEAFYVLNSEVALAALLAQSLHEAPLWDAAGCSYISSPPGCSVNHLLGYTISSKNCYRRDEQQENCDDLSVWNGRRCGVEILRDGITAGICSELALFHQVCDPNKWKELVNIHPSLPPGIIPLSLSFILSAGAMLVAAVMIAGRARHFLKKSEPRFQERKALFAIAAALSKNTVRSEAVFEWMRGFMQRPGITSPAAYSRSAVVPFLIQAGEAQSEVKEPSSSFAL